MERTTSSKVSAWKHVRSPGCSRIGLESGLVAKVISFIKPTGFLQTNEIKGWWWRRSLLLDQPDFFAKRNIIIKIPFITQKLAIIIIIFAQIWLVRDKINPLAPAPIALETWGRFPASPAAAAAPQVNAAASRCRPPLPRAPLNTTEAKGGRCLCTDGLIPWTHP